MAAERSIVCDSDAQENEENQTNIGEKTKSRQKQKHPKFSDVECNAVLVKSFMNVFTHSTNQDFRRRALQTEKAENAEKLDQNLLASLERLLVSPEDKKTETNSYLEEDVLLLDHNEIANENTDAEKNVHALDQVGLSGPELNNFEELVHFDFDFFF